VAVAVVSPLPGERVIAEFFRQRMVRGKE